MSASILTRRVSLYAVARSDDGAGGFTRADTLIGQRWCELRVASWSEQQRAERREQRVSHVLRLRWDPDLVGLGPEAKAVVTDGAGVQRTLAIKTVIDPDDKRQFIEVQCLEGGPI